MKEKNIIDKRHIKLEHVLKPDYIPFLSGRPDREKIINQEDMTNLKINLNVCNTVEDFLRMS